MRLPPALNDRHALYERCVQNPAVVVRLLRAIHGGSERGPRVLREDFSARARVSRAWCEAIPGGRAVAVDLDAGLLRQPGRGVRAVVGDVLRQPVTGPRADVIFVGNFSIGEIHTRAALVRYLRRSRARLSPGGVFVCDTYGGASAFRLGAVQRTHPWTQPSAAEAGRRRGAGDDLRIRYTWEQREADPLTGMVTNAIHFRVLRGTEVVGEITDAFVYRWRLWSVPELREAMTEAGFDRAEVYADVAEAVDETGRPYVRALTESGDLNDGAGPGEGYIVCVAGRRGPARPARPARSSRSRRKGRGVTRSGRR